MMKAKQEMQRKLEQQGKEAQVNVGLKRINKETGQANQFAFRSHVSCWGSHWHKTFGWGYKCCFSHNRDDKKCGGLAAKER